MNLFIFIILNSSRPYICMQISNHINESQTLSPKQRTNKTWVSVFVSWIISYYYQVVRIGRACVRSSGITEYTKVYTMLYDLPCWLEILQLLFRLPLEWMPITVPYSAAFFHITYVNSTLWKVINASSTCWRKWKWLFREKLWLWDLILSENHSPSPKETRWAYIIETGIYKKTLYIHCEVSMLY